MHEVRLQYTVPYQEASRDSLKPEGNWPILNGRFQTYVLLDQTYYTRAYALGSEDPRTLAAEKELKRVEDELRSAGIPPFTNTGVEQARIDTVVSETFPFLDPDMSETYPTEHRQANNLATHYSQRMTPFFYQFSSTDRGKRLVSYRALTVVEKELANEFISILASRTDYMIKKYGSVRNFFWEKDGIDWSFIFNNPDNNQRIQTYASNYAARRAMKLEIERYSPHDVCAQTSTNGNRKLVDNAGSKTRDYTDTVKEFLLLLGLDEISHKLIGVSSNRAGGICYTLGKIGNRDPCFFIRIQVVESLGLGNIIACVLTKQGTLQLTISVAEHLSHYINWEGLLQSFHRCF